MSSEPMPDDHRAAHEKLRGEDKLLAMRVDAIKEHVHELDAEQHDHGRRISKLENERYFIWGAAAAFGAALTYILRGLGLRE